MTAELELAVLPRSAALRGVRRRIGLRWLGRPSAYAVGVCTVSLLTMAITLIVPRLLDPVAFGSFALLGTMLQYSARADLGLSQLADRDLAARDNPSAARGLDLLRASWALGLAAILVLTPIAAAVGLVSGRFAPFDAVLAVVGGVLGMVAHAPASIYRAACQHWEFALLALLQQAGLTAPRLAGLLIAGVTGCFAALAIWSGLLALAFAQPRQALYWRRAPIVAMVRASLPLFAFSSLWLVYITANRWISALLSSPGELGLFAFGANLAMVGLAVIGAVAQVRYPQLLVAMARAPERRSDTLEREIRRMSFALAAAALCAIGLTAPAIALVFPGYEGAAGATVGLALSCVPLGAIAWIIPMAMVLAKTPLRDGVQVFGPAIVVLGAAIPVGDAVAGVSGQGWACAVAALFVLVRLVAMLRRSEILSPHAARRVVVAQATLLTLLTLAAAVWASVGAAHWGAGAAAPSIAQVRGTSR